MKIFEENEEKRTLRRKVKEQFLKKESISVLCPLCNTVPKVLISNEFELLIECQCGQLSVGEKY